MASTPSLPSRQNPYTLDDRTPSHEELVAERRLGRTRVSVIGGRKGAFEYAHLRIRLPNLSDSEMFRPKASAPVPTSYFLMRRSQDGHVSATGMFKATFPWATKAEERAELERLRQLLTNDSEEVAGNFWCPAEAALALAADYNISAWIRALLDPRPVRLTNGNLKDIAEPPTFIMPASKKHSSPDSVRSPSKRTVSRETRSTSPVKTDPSERPKASPKKRGRKPKKTAEDGEVNGASKSLQDIINGAPTLDATDASIDGEAAVAAVAAAVNGEAEPLPENTARVTITSDIIENEDGEEVKHTDVKIDMPLDADEQALPASPEQMTADAKKIVKDALELQKSKGGDEGRKSGSKRGRKRKASEAQADEKEVAAVTEQKKGPEEVIEELVPAESSSEPPSKRTRVMVPAEEYQREKMQRRALLGTAVAAGIGFAWTAAPYAFDFATGLLKNV